MTKVEMIEKITGVDSNNWNFENLVDCDNILFSTYSISDLTYLYEAVKQEEYQKQQWK